MNLLFVCNIKQYAFMLHFVHNNKFVLINLKLLILVSIDTIINNLTFIISNLNYLFENCINGVKILESQKVIY